MLIMSLNVNRIINRYVRNLVVDSKLQTQTACFVDELIIIWDNISSLSISVVFTHTEIMDIIQFVCTS